MAWIRPTRIFCTSTLHSSAHSSASLNNQGSGPLGPSLKFSLPLTLTVLYLDFIITIVSTYTVLTVSQAPFTGTPWSEPYVSQLINEETDAQWSPIFGSDQTASCCGTVWLRLCLPAHTTLGSSPLSSGHSLCTETGGINLSFSLHDTLSKPTFCLDGAMGQSRCRKALAGDWMVSF